LASSVTVNEPVSVPAVVGVNVIDTEQLVPDASVAPHVLALMV
jgi:hypothetical protein